MLQLLIGPAALAARYALVVAARWLANAGHGAYAATARTFTLPIDNAGSVIAAGALFGLAVAWRKLAKVWGGKT